MAVHSKRMQKRSRFSRALLLEWSHVFSLTLPREGMSRVKRGEGHRTYLF